MRTLPRTTPFAALAMTMCLSACARGPQLHVISGPTMGTVYTVRWVGDAPISEYALRTEIEAELARVDAQMSRYREDSELAHFNASRSTAPQAASAEFAQLLSESIAISSASQGAFDVTIAPLIDAWGFGPAQAKPRALTVDELQALRARCGSELLEVSSSPTTVRKLRADVEVDLNAIAPGQTADRIARLLQRHAIRNYLIDLGGELRVHGENAEGNAWRIAVDDPRHEEQVPFAEVELSDGAISTSGGYRHFRIVDGQRVSHIIDPRSGEPAPLHVGSVVVIAPTAAEADGWSTAMFVLGDEAGLQLAEERGLAVLFLVFDGNGIRERASTEFMRQRWKKI